MMRMPERERKKRELNGWQADINNHSKDIWKKIPRDLLDDVITQLFLPRRTPETVPPNLEKIELYLQHLFNLCLENLLHNASSLPLDPVKDMLEKWIQIQPKIGETPAAFAEIFCEEVINLQSEATLPIYVRNQNSTLLITRRGQNYQLSTFRSSLVVQMVMSTIGCHSVVFPETVETIQNVDLLSSPEFASVLHELTIGNIDISLPKILKGGTEFVNKRDVADPFLVSDWVVGLLVPDCHDNNSCDISQDMPQITKKIRDQVNFPMKPRGSLPFRRSGMYMSLKVGLQLKMIESFDDDDTMNPAAAKLVYKLLMLNILTFVAKKHFYARRVDFDLSCQILAKLGMRVAKLEKTFNALQTSVVPEMLTIITNLKEYCLQFTESIVKRLSKKVKDVWRKISAVRETLPHPWDTCRSYATKGFDFEGDLNHELPLLDECVEKIQKIIAQPDENYTPSHDSLLPMNRYQTSDLILDSAADLSRGSFNEKVWLYDTENYLKYHCTINEAGGASTIYELFSKYTQKATKVYQDDPIGTSQLILVALKGLHLMDQIATNKCPLLKQYNPEVNVKLFDCLLLPFLPDMLLLDELVDYFSLRAQKAPRSGILTSNVVTSKTFSVCYAKQQADMNDLREKIIYDTEAEEDEMFDTVKNCREVCKEMQDKNQAGSCKCNFENIRWRSRDGQWRNKRRIGKPCANCRLFRELRKERFSIPYYERALPPQEVYQWAVVFELLAPEEFAVWREFLAYFKYEVLREDVFNGEGNQKHATKWLDYSNLSKYTNQKPRLVTLGSASIPASSTHLTHTNLDVLTNTNDKYIIENGMSCKFQYEQEPPETPIPDFREVCSFQLKNTTEFTPYENLQEALTSTTHTQNSILARQYVCHEQLALSEFVAFGSLRAGHRVQLRNLYQAIYSGTISLEEEPALALILQAIWQVGPRNEQNERDSHSDFKDQPFAEEFLDMLDKLVETNKMNYSSTRIVLTSVLIARRIGEINPAVSEQCYRKLTKWREILKEWANKIQDQLDELKLTSTEETSLSLKRNLWEVLLSTRLSYSISGPSMLDNVMWEKQDIVLWLEMLHHHRLSINTNQLNLSKFMQALQNVGDTVPLRLNVKEKLGNREPAFLEALHCFTVDTIWKKAASFNLKSMEFDGESAVKIIYENAGVTPVNRDCVTVDIVRGASLVNGYSQSGLPPQIQGNKLFQRYFREATNFRVQRETRCLTRSVTKFQGKYYEFHQTPKVMGNSMGLNQNCTMGNFISIYDTGRKSSITSGEYFSCSENDDTSDEEESDTQTNSESDDTNDEDESDTQSNSENADTIDDEERDSHSKSENEDMNDVEQRSSHSSSKNEDMNDVKQRSSHSNSENGDTDDEEDYNEYIYLNSGNDYPNKEKSGTFSNSENESTDENKSDISSISDEEDIDEGDYTDTSLQSDKGIDLENECYSSSNSEDEDSDSKISKSNFNNDLFKYDDETDYGLVIKEIQNEGVPPLVLIDPEIFKDSISDYFIQNYSHWLDPSQNKIYFRPDAPNITSPPHDYILEKLSPRFGDMWRLYDVRSNEYILNCNSSGFEKVISTLKRLEKPQYINVTMEKESQRRTAHLYRYHLKFLVRDTGNHVSEEYSGYSISNSRIGKGTLIGLRQGLILQQQVKQGDTRKMLIVPHSSIKIIPGKFHQYVIFNRKSLSQPPCFVYEFDDVLTRLKAHNSKSAWLYLAALHAATSSPLPDPYTRITGTEMAVRILQSAYVWSGVPYDNESRTVLEFIKSLAPKRKYYGVSREEEQGLQYCREDWATMEVIEWPEGLSPMAAYDGFGIIVDTLFRNSENLAVLHGANTHVKDNDRISSAEKLGIRAYFRYLPMYNPLVTVERPHYFAETQLELVNRRAGQVSHLSLRQCQKDLQLANLIIISTARLTNSMAPLLQNELLQKGNLRRFLLIKEKLDGPLPVMPLKTEGGFYDLVTLDFRYKWLKLYTMAINCKSAEDVRVMTCVLSTVAYRGAPLEQVANLHVISEYAALGTVEFPELEVPDEIDIDNPDNSYDDPSCHNYDKFVIKEILQAHPKPFTEYVQPSKPSIIYLHCMEEEDEEEEYAKQEEDYLKRVRDCCPGISTQLKSLIWPSGKIQGTKVSEILESNNIDSAPAIRKINQQLAVWYRNYKLKLFVEEVQDHLNQIYDQEHDRKREKFVQASELRESSTECRVEVGMGFVVDMKELLVPSHAVKREETREIFKTGRVAEPEICLGADFTEMSKQCQARIAEVGSELWRMMSCNPSRKVINLAGIGQRRDPGSLLQVLRYKPTDEKGRILQEYAGAYGVLKTHFQQINRCLQAKQEAELKREISNPGHENWSPAEYPEWLLLELELNIKIRSVQVEVAKQMMNMPNGKNGVTQFNMGEGKTSVIVPMLCAVLAKKNKQLCRVTVLSSMFNMNLASLAFSIGGLLNRRVYSIPCRRDLDIDENCVERIAQVYKECLNLQGVVLTLPEHRLSFRLLGYDMILKKNVSLGLKMLEVENWLRDHVRDIMDESDELFNVKSQLVYTIGEHVPIDGGDVRWTTSQRILSIVQKVGKDFLQTHGTSVVEFDPKQNGPHQFSPIRILNAKYLGDFVELIADRFLDEIVTISEADKPAVKMFLVKQDICLEDHKNVMEDIFDEDQDTLNKIMLVSGYLKRGVLGLALMKRWRVEYGINPTQDFRRMAVPFRAKDVAAEKTEFGHPDLAIILTHLSYYYAGLSDTQLQETFDILKRKKDYKACYSSWIADIPADRFSEQSLDLQEYISLNLKDAGQKMRLFDLLRKHKMVIDFWLSHAVFPRESKQFPGKLVMTAWDLCYERQRFPVTGFSGTNDSQILLPLMTPQQDLPQLQDTNKKVEAILLQPQNEGHRGFEVDVKCEEILESMKDDNLTILIDAGALMLELDNEQMATKWLEVNPKIEAAIYFTNDNHLFVKCRTDHGQGTPFDASPYQGQLKKCGVFLDDQHTRGTDIKFPAGAKACVTVGARMKRDKLIQACMRMRKLGQGHSVTFYLSREAHCQVMNSDDPKGEIPTNAVLEWVCENTKQFNDDGLLYWALAGRNYAQRLAAEDNFHSDYHNLAYENIIPVELKADNLADQCVDDEVITLEEMYGQHTQTELLTELIPKWFASAKNKLKRKNKGHEMHEEVFCRYDEICRLVKTTCLVYAPEKKHLSSNSGMMEEEQEKELELEKETEVEEARMVERPKKAVEATPSLHQDVKDFVFTGRPISTACEGIVRLCDMFARTSFRGELQAGCWSENVFATVDFVSVIKPYHKYYQNTDNHLRPIQYFASCIIKSKHNKSKHKKKSKSLQQILVLSPFEVNELLPSFRSGQTQCTLHMFSYRRKEKQDLLVNNSRLQFPITRKGVIIEEHSGAIMSLLLASGNLYFISMAEQLAFLKFLGLALPPWSKEEKEASEEGLITKTGFLHPEENGGGPSSGFLEDPTGLIKKILMCWHPILSELTHVMRLLEEKRKIENITS